MFASALVLTTGCPSSESGSHGSARMFNYAPETIERYDGDELVFRVEHTYDSSGRNVTMEQQGHTHDGPEYVMAIAIEYSDDGKLERVTQDETFSDTSHDVTIAEWQHDAAGRPSRIDYVRVSEDADPDLSGTSEWSITIERDELHRPVRLVRTDDIPDNNDIRMKFEYDPATGKLSKYEYSDDVVWLEWDGDRIARSSWSDEGYEPAVTVFEYDSNGFLRASCGFDAGAQDCSSAGWKTTFSVDDPVHPTQLVICEGPEDPCSQRRTVVRYTDKGDSSTPEMEWMPLMDWVTYVYGRGEVDRGTELGW